VTYHGKAIVPGTNKTANQLQNETFAQARTQGINKRGTYSATINYTQQPTQQTQTIQPIQQTQTIQPTQTNATSKVLVTRVYMPINQKSNILDLIIKRLHRSMIQEF